LSDSLIITSPFRVCSAAECHQRLVGWSLTIVFNLVITIPSSCQQIEDQRRPRDIFTEFNFTLKEGRMGLRGVLDDHNTDGYLTSEGIGAMLATLVIDIKSVERQYFEVNVRPSGV